MNIYYVKWNVNVTDFITATSCERHGAPDHQKYDCLLSRVISEGDYKEN